MKLSMPNLTKSTSILIVGGTGSVVLSKSIGAFRLLSTLAIGFEPERIESLALGIQESLSEKVGTMPIMKQVVGSCTIQKAIQ